MKIVAYAWTIDTSRQFRGPFMNLYWIRLRPREVACDRKVNNLDAGENH